MHQSPIDLPATLLALAGILRNAADAAASAAVTLANLSEQDTEVVGTLRLVIDHNRMSVRWNGRSCHLGATIAFRLLERLAQRSNHYVTHDELLNDVWRGAPRSPSAIRSAVSILRARLVSAGMEDLASAIDGSNTGRYGLMLEGLR